MKIDKSQIGRPCKFRGYDNVDYFGNVLNVKRASGTTWVQIGYYINGKSEMYNVSVERANFNRVEIY